MINKYQLNYTAVSPISHGDEMTLSVISPFRKQKIYHEGKYIDVPVVSGNSMRGGGLRRLAIKRMLEMLDVPVESLSQSCYYFLLNGGALTSGGVETDVDKTLTIRSKLPLISLLGSATGNIMLSGRISVGLIYVVGKETKQLTNIESDNSVNKFLDTIFYTRKDDYEKEKVDKTSQMKYESEVLIPGTPLSQYIYLYTNSELEQSAFGFMMNVFKEKPQLGGKANVGHGFVDVSCDKEFPDDKTFIDFLNENKEDIKDYLNNF